MERFKVIGVCEVGGVEPGGVVELDPEKVNIPALIAGGHVEPVAERKATRTTRAGDDGSGGH